MLMWFFNDEVKQLEVTKSNLRTVLCDGVFGVVQKPVMAPVQRITIKKHNHPEGKEIDYERLP